MSPPADWGCQRALSNNVIGFESTPTRFPARAKSLGNLPHRTDWAKIPPLKIHSHTTQWRPSVATIPDNFLGLPRPHAEYRKAKYAVLPIPYDSTVSFQVGTRHGPRAILTASQQVELFDQEYEREFFKAGVATLDPVAPNMAGPKAMHEDIFAEARRVVADGKFLIGLGGEHSITSALVRAVLTKHKKLSVLQIDAHADLRAEYEDTPFSHAAVMRRVVEMGVKVTGVGIRNYCIEEHRFMKSKKIAPISARQAREDADWMMRAVESLGENVYVTIDIDGFDPAYAPGTGTPEPGGLDWFQVTDLLKATAMNRRIVAADVVEVIPLPGNAMTEFLAAKLIYKLIAHIEANGGGRRTKN
ncbi:MAG: agmatinase [Planctomycetota bacterium]|nr:MAG: agmatinase [Planctomycetota bacterium]